MGKRIAALLLAVALVFPLTTAAYAWGVNGSGSFADAAKRYGFLDSEAQIVYNGEISWQDYDEIYPGSAVYIPIAIEDDTGNVTRATSQGVKKDKVTVSHKVTRGARYVSGVSIVDGGKEKVTGLESGAYAKVQLTNSFASTGTANVEVKLVLAINKLTYQDTEVELYCTMENRTVYIDYDTVYGAQLPAQFEAGYDYSGEATFDMGGGVTYTARVKAKQKYVIDYTAEQNEEITARYPKSKLEFHGFNGDNDTFASNGKLQIELDEGTYYKNGQYKAYAYKISGNTLVPVESAISKAGDITIYTRTLDNYVLSDTDLLATDYEAPASASSAASQASSVPATTSRPAANEPQAPPMGGAPLDASSSVPQAPPTTSQPETPVASSATPPPASLSYIGAENGGTENPLTGVPPLAAITLVGIMTGASALCLRPRKKGSSHK